MPGVAAEEAPLAPVPANADLVLVIDDDPAARDLISRFLAREGFAVQTASDGDSGLSLARRYRPRAIVLDVSMPRMDGWAVLSSLKADPELSDIPVIMVSVIDELTLGYSLGASNYLTKPIDWNRLKKAMDQLRPERPARPILVVEDDADTRSRLRATLARAGWTVDEAENGRVALEKVRENPPELILLDLMMPEMDGYGFLQELHKNPDWRSIPVVVVTAKDITADDRRELKGQAIRILQKGWVTMREVASEVRKAAAEAGGWVPDEASAPRLPEESEAEPENPSGNA